MIMFPQKIKTKIFVMFDLLKKDFDRQQKCHLIVQNRINIRLPQQQKSY